MDRQRGAFRQHDDHRLLSRGEIADDRDNARHERTLRGIAHRRSLTVEQRHLGSLQNVRAGIALGGLNDKERLDVAQNGESKCRCRGRIESSERRQGRTKVALSELNITTCGDGARRIETDDCTWTYIAAEGWWWTNRRRCRQRRGVRADIEVEIDADAFEEVVLQGDEADFDRHLQVLEPTQLLQQVCDFFVHFLCLANDEAQVRIEAVDRAWATDFRPGLRGDGRGDQIDERIEVGLITALQAARAEWDGLRRAGRCLSAAAHHREAVGTSHLCEDRRG